jgi:hypothetical protein
MNKLPESGNILEYLDLFSIKDAKSYSLIHTAEYKSCECSSNTVYSMILK